MIPNSVPFGGCQTRKGRIFPESKIYLVNLPILREIPALYDTSLYAHKTLPPASPQQAWSVTEARTGLAICYASTRFLAVNAAQSAILKIGNKHFSEAIKAGLHRQEEAQGCESPTQTK